MGTVIFELSDKKNVAENTVFLYYFQNGRVSIEKKNTASDEYFETVLGWMIECKSYLEDFLNNLVDVSSHLYYKRDNKNDSNFDFDIPLLQHSETEHHYAGYDMVIKAYIKPIPFTDKE